MPGLDPGIHQLRKRLAKKLDCRVKPGNDEWKGRRDDRLVSLDSPSPNSDKAPRLRRQIRPKEISKETFDVSRLP
jgi:hypothetical protein